MADSCHYCVILTSSLHAASPFSASQFLKAYENEFLDVIDAKVSLPKLRRRGVISADVQATIENADDEDAREALYDHLVHSGTVESLKKYCNVAIAADGYPRMQQLGREMLAMLPQGGWLELCCGCGWLGVRLLHVCVWLAESSGT